MKAWHFCKQKNERIVTGYGNIIVKPGLKLIHDGELLMCSSGLHASSKPFDALKYAPGSVVCRVSCGGKILQQKDKLVCTERTILWAYNAKDILWKLARLCALDVIHLWDAPEIVVRYLHTGDESIKITAWTAARAATRAAALAATRAAARAAALAATQDAARDAAWTAALSAARAAARDAALATVRDAARIATWDATWDAARAAQNKRLYRMIMKGRPTNIPA